MVNTMGALLASLAAGMPVAFALGVAGTIYLLGRDAYPGIMASRFFSSLNAVGLTAIPFFILAAEVLGRSGSTRRIIRFFDTMLGHLKGGLAVVAVFSTMFFSAVSGSTVATAAAIGAVIIPEMLEKGYDRRFTIGLIAIAGALGILIPPSIPMILYGMVTETPIGRLFRAGMVPGIVLGLLLAGLAYVYAQRMNLPVRERATWAERMQAFREATWVLGMPLLVLGGIYGGIFTPTEAAAVGAVYALFVAIAIERVPLREIFPMLTRSATTAAMILMILGAAQLLGYALTAERIPHAVAQWVTGLDLTPTTFLLLINLLLIILGMFLEINSIILIMMPILFPILLNLGINPVHFAIVLVVNMELAVITPPIGLNLFIISGISRTPVLEVFRGTIPFALLYLGFLLFLAFGPGVESYFASIR